MSVIIKRGAPLPAYGFENYQTVKDGQTRVRLKIYEGEKKYVKYNHLLKDTTIEGLSPKPKGETKILVEFNIDVNGILYIKAVEKSEINGQSISLSIKNDEISFSDEEMKKLREKMEQMAKKIKASILQNEVLDINEIEIKNSLKMNEADYEEIINNLKRDFDFFIKMQSQVYPIIHLFIGDENEGDANINNIDVNESSLMENTSMHPANLSGLLNITDDGTMNNKIVKFNPADDTNYKTESNSLIDKEYYSFNGHDIHTIKIYFTHFFLTHIFLN